MADERTPLPQLQEMADYIERQNATFTRQQEEMTERINAFAKREATLQQALAQALEQAEQARMLAQAAQTASAANIAVPTAPTAATNTIATATRPRPRLPDVSMFSGERKDYKVWAISARLKLRIDAESIGADHNKYAYLFARMESRAQALTAGWFTDHAENADPEEFLGHLDSMFTDPYDAERALAKLSSLRQGPRELFANFLPKFERLLHESQVHANDRVAINYLRETLNPQMKTAMVGPTVYTTYATFVNALTTVASQLDEIAWSSKRAADAKSRHYGSSSTKNPDQMDWEHTRANTAKTGQLTAGDKDRYRREGRCFRCSELGHISRNCPRKGNGQTRANAATTASTSKGDPDQSESGNDTPQE